MIAERPAGWPREPAGEAAGASPTDRAETRQGPRAEAPERASGGLAGGLGVAPLATLLRWLIVGLIAWGALGVCDRTLTAAWQRAPLPGSAGGYRGTALDRWYQGEQERRFAELERRLAAVCAASQSGAAPTRPAIPSGEGC